MSNQEDLDEMNHCVEALKQAGIHPSQENVDWLTAQRLHAYGEGYGDGLFQHNEDIRAAREALDDAKADIECAMKRVAGFLVLQ